MAATNNNGITTIDADEALALILSSRTRGKADDYKKCVTELLENEGNFWAHIEQRFPGRKEGTVKSALGNAIKELEAPVLVSQNEEHGVYLVKVA